MSYDDRGRTTSITSPTGLTVKAKYDGRGNLIGSIDTDGLKSTYEYNANGQIRFQKAPDGQVTEFNYDQFGNPNQMVDSRGNATTAVYDANGRMDTASSTFQVNGQTYTLGMEYDYDKEGRTTESRNSRGHVQKMVYDKLGRATSTTDVLGNITTFRHDIQDASIGQSIGLVTGNRSIITRVDEVTLPDNTPTNGADNPKMIRKYDQANRLVAEISPTGLETRYVYDELGRLIETIVPDLTLNDWSDNPRLKREYTAGSRLKAQTDIFGNWERYVYNDLGQMTSTRDVLNNLTTYTYNDGGQVATIVDPRDRKTQYRYDIKGRLEEALFFDNTKASWTYDELARVKTETNELGQKTTYEYDQYSQVNAVINALDERTEFKYNDRRKLVEVKDALNQVTRYKYDQFANHVETTFQNGDKVSMGYDAFDRMTSVTDERQFTTTYRYNNLSQLTEIEQPNTAKTKYDYDTLGRMVAMTDANQRRTEFEYDAFNRVVADKLSMGQTNRSVYNKFGQLESATDFNGDRINYRYDAYGRVDQKSFTDTRVATVGYTYDDVTSQLKTVTDGRGVTSYGYDGRDRLAKITHPDTQYVEYGYDLLDNVTSVKTNAGTTSYGYDKLNRLDTVKDGSKVLADYDYDAAGNLIRTKFANSSVETRTYDGRNRLKSLNTKNVVGVTFSGFEYELDGAGNRKKVTEHNGRIVEYDYDSVNRLTQEKITDASLGNRTTGYIYDLVGNRQTKTDTLEGTTNYQYDANDRLLNTTNGNQITQFTYDNNGSMKTRSNGATTLTYDWINDGENRLTQVSNGTNQTQYVYDAFGDRVATIAGGNRTNYLSAGIWGLPEVLMEYDTNGNITADYVHGNGTVRSRRDNREVYHHTDGLGSTRALTDTVGLVTDRYVYDAYGVLLEHQGTFGNSFQFAGEQRDATTGLDYLRARYYDSSLGRFVSSDPFAGFMSDPMSLHNYQYAHANPTRYTDPSGYFSLAEINVGQIIQNTLQLTGAGLAGVGIGGGLGLLGSAALDGASAEQLISMVGDWGAGFASGASGGFLSDLRNAWTGEVVEPRYEAMYNLGNVAGTGVMMLVGLKTPSYATTTVGATRWLSVGVAGIEAFGAGYGAGTGVRNLYQSWQEDGKWEWKDAFNLINFLGLASFSVGIRSAIKSSRAVNNLDANPRLKQAGKTAQEIGDGAPPPSTVPDEGNCFVAGTEILTPDGLKNIEDIQVGDWVIADDPTTPGEIESRQVTNTFIRHTDKLVDLYIDGEVISTTGEHPFWTPDQGWIEAKNLTVGSSVQLESGQIIDIDGINQRNGTFTVYNFSVEEFHTYYVSELGVLVHNARYNPKKPQTKKSDFVDDYEDFDEESLPDLQKGRDVTKGDRGRFKDPEKIEQQFEEIGNAQRRIRQGKDKTKVIDSISKSEQRLNNELKNTDPRDIE
jgi:RHS repeat-associated protein